MKDINVLFSPAEIPDFKAELNALELKAGVNTPEIGKLVSKVSGSNPRTEMNVYGYFKRGVRTYPRHKVNILAKIFEVDVSVITKLNSTISGENPKEPLKLPGDFDVRVAIKSFPAEMSSLSEFLLWINFLRNKEKFQDNDQA